MSVTHCGDHFRPHIPDDLGQQSRNPGIKFDRKIAVELERSYLATQLPRGTTHRIRPLSELSFFTVQKITNVGDLHKHCFHLCGGLRVAGYAFIRARWSLLTARKAATGAKSGKEEGLDQ